MEYDDEDIFDDDLEVLDIVEFGFPRRIYPRSDHFHEVDNLLFFQRFRLQKPTVLSLLAQIEHELEYQHDLNNSISPINQVLTCLRFYASAGHLASISDFIGMHVSTASRIIGRVSRAIAQLAPRYINMPEVQDVINVQNNFFNIASFPRVLGCIDGTHIRIQSPGGEDPEVFRNRKGYFSINTQVVGDSTLKIRNIVARWPGSSHDATIFANSRIRALFTGGTFPNSILLGDSGYALTPYLLTPLLNPNTRGERLYNEAHIRTRNSVERLFGVWKRRFPVLAYGLRLKLQTVLTIIVATAVLHNIAIEMNEDEPPPSENINPEELNYLIAVNQIPALANINGVDGGVLNTRTELINNYFNNL